MISKCPLSNLHVNFIEAGFYNFCKNVVFWDTVQSGRWIWVFWRILMDPSSGLDLQSVQSLQPQQWGKYISLKFWYQNTRLHGVTCQKTTIQSPLWKLQGSLSVVDREWKLTQTDWLHSDYKDVDKNKQLMTWNRRN